MKRRYSVWRLRLGGYRSEAMRRLGKTPDEGKLQLGDIVICCSLLGLLNIDILPESVPYGESIMLIATSLVVLLGIFINLRRMAPRPCWGKAMWATGMIALFWSVLPWVLLGGDNVKDMTPQLALQLSLSSLFMWLVFGVCALRYRYIRRRSEQEIAFMRMRERRRKQIVY